MTATSTIVAILRGRVPALVVIALVGWLGGWLVGSVPTADAHPFGPPSTARVSVDGGTVDIRWKAAEDDWVSLGEHVGAFTGPADATGTQLLAESERLRQYFLDHFGVMQDGRPCNGRVESLDDPLGDGLHLVFECAQPVAQIELTVSPLTDLNENYRTVVSADVPSEPAQALYAAAAPTQLWRFDAAGGSDSVLVLGAVAAVIGVGGVIGLGTWWRRNATDRHVTREGSLA